MTICWAPGCNHNSEKDVLIIILVWELVYVHVIFDMARKKMGQNYSHIMKENLPPSAKQQKLEEPGEMESQPSTSAIESEVSASLDKQPESQKPDQVESQPRALEQSGTLVSDAGPSISGVDPNKPSVAMTKQNCIWHN
ncbi:hypothetical protein NQ315_008215 [Exocentrus adspersus]|uniref:Uncharacterized protein n=1 Tax=Exocentrus adspersus TaxID=1586481 RepID=A0AAV8VLW2_9CUCU|nr:hypothetical protein NQ315_008215 [Exocentrus adspersus]